MYFRSSDCSCAAGQSNWTRLHNWTVPASDAVLNIFLKIGKAILNPADVLLDISFNFHTLVVQYQASGFLDFTFASSTLPFT